MAVAWDASSPVTVREVLEALNGARAQALAYTTVMTVMNRLVAKDVLSRRRHGRGFVYEPTAADAAGVAVQNVMREHGDAAVAHFVDAARADPKLLRTLQRLIDSEP